MSAGTSPRSSTRMTMPTRSAFHAVAVIVPSGCTTGQTRLFTSRSLPWRFQSSAPSCG